jgi:hypothetical protein
VRSPRPGSFARPALDQLAHAVRRPETPVGRTSREPARPGVVVGKRAAGYTEAAHAKHRPSIEARCSNAKLPVVFAANFFVFALRHVVAAPVRTRFDQFGKQMVRAVLETRGPIETDAEVPADTRRIDLWFMPDPARRSVPITSVYWGASRVA